MANTNAPRGFEPVRHYAGGVARTSRYEIASALAANIGKGDPVKSTGTTKQITIAAGGNTIRGVFAGCDYTTSDNRKVWAPNWVTGTALKTGTVCNAYVYDDPMILFRIQASAGFVAADVANTADFVVSAPTAATGNSTTQLDSANIGQGNLTIVDLDRVTGNDYGTNAKVLVLINEHELKASVSGV